MLALFLLRCSWKLSLSSLSTGVKVYTWNTSNAGHRLYWCYYIIFTEKRNQLTYTTVVLYLTFAYIFPSLKLVKSKIFLHVKKPSLVNMFVADHRKLCIGIPPLVKGPKGRSCPLAVCGKTKRSKNTGLKHNLNPVLPNTTKSLLSIPDGKVTVPLIIWNVLQIFRLYLLLFKNRRAAFLYFGLGFWGSHGT